MEAKRQTERHIRSTEKAIPSTKNSLLFKNESEVKTFTDKQKLTELVARRPAIQEILKAEMKGH